MTGDRNAKIRERAYLMWEREGRPAGRDMDYWLRAEAEMQAEAQPRRITARKVPAVTARAEAAPARKPRTPKAAVPASKPHAKSAANGRPVSVKA